MSSFTDKTCVIIQFTAWKDKTCALIQQFDYFFKHIAQFAGSATLHVKDRDKSRMPREGADQEQQPAAAACPQTWHTYLPQQSLTAPSHTQALPIMAFLTMIVVLEMSVVFTGQSCNTLDWLTFCLSKPAVPAWCYYLLTCARLACRSRKAMTPFKVFDGTLQRPLYLCTMKAPPCGVGMEMEQRLGLLVNVGQICYK